VTFFALWSNLVTSQIATLLQLDTPAAAKRKTAAQSSADPVTLTFEPRSFWLPAFFFPQGNLFLVVWYRQQYTKV
jgi:hypothetical protein